jgi:hypothetical protein
MNTFNCTERTLFNFLHKQQYKKIKDQGIGNNIIVTIPSSYDIANSIFYRDLGFTVNRYEDTKDACDYFEYLLHNSFYMNLIIFINGRNITHHYRDQLGNNLQNGDMRIDEVEENNEFESNPPLKNATGTAIIFHF